MDRFVECLMCKAESENTTSQYPQMQEFLNGTSQYQLSSHSPLTYMLLVFVGECEALGSPVGRVWLPGFESSPTSSKPTPTSTQSSTIISTRTAATSTTTSSQTP